MEVLIDVNKSVNYGIESSDYYYIGKDEDEFIKINSEVNKWYGNRRDLN